MFCGLVLLVLSDERPSLKTLDLVHTPHIGSTIDL